MKDSQAAQLIDRGNQFDVDRIRADFPILAQQVHGHPLVYLDNAATTQKPLSVINSIDTFYREYNANIHRGIHALSEKATHVYETVRKKICTHLNAASTQEIIFVRGTTEGINLVAHSLGGMRLSPSKEVLITEMEHHSNIVPWQIICAQTGARLRYIPINQAGELILDELGQLLTEKTAIVALSHISNALGTINPIKDMIDRAHQVGAKVLIDGAQAAPHMMIDVQALNCDFYTFSGHKFFAPTGIGVLYGREALLDAMPPYQGGGDMVKTVRMSKTEYGDLPHKFEAGTPHIAGVVGLGAALDYLQTIGFEPIHQYEKGLLEYATKRIQAIDGLNLIGTAKEKSSILSFTLAGIHPHDMSTIIDQQGIAIRAGHHCAMPVMEKFGLPATARASFSFYNTTQEVDRLVDGIMRCKTIFNG